MRVFGFITLGALVCLPLVGFSQNNPLADSLYKQGMNYYNSGTYKQAEFYLHEAFLLYQKGAAPATVLESGIHYAGALVSRSKYDQAVSLYQRMNKLAEEQDDKRRQAQIENDLGWAYIKMGKRKEAMQHLHKALPLAEQEADTLRLGYIYNNISSIYSTEGDYESSLKFRKKSLAYLQAVGDTYSIAISLNNIALTYKQLALYDKAIEYYQRSLEIKKKLNNANSLATAYNNIGVLYQETDELDKALIAYQKSLAYRKKAGDPYKRAQTLNNIGTLYNQLGQPQKALNYYRESLKLKEQVVRPLSLATSYTNIANRLWDLDKHKEAINYYVKALDLKKEAGNPRAIASSLLDLARVKNTPESRSDAFTDALKAKAIADSVQDYSLQVKASLQLGSLYLAEGNSGEAISSYKKSLAYGSISSKNEQLAPLLSLARAYNSQQSDSALIYGKRAIDIIEKTRSGIGTSQSFKSTYFQQYSDFYVDMAAWVLKYKQDKVRAYKLIELAKARALSDELLQASRRLDEALPEKERLIRNKKLGHIDSLYTRLDYSSGPETAELLQKKIQRANFEFSAYENELSQKYPGYKRLEVKEPISLSRAQEICDTGTAVLEFAISSGRVVAYLIRNGSVQTHQFEVNQDAAHNLNMLVENFRDAILANAGRQELAYHSQPLYQLLLAPFKDALSGISNLIIVPDGPLAYLPFEALSNNSRYLIEDYTIKYEPSLTALTLLKTPQKQYKHQLLAVAGAGSDNNENNPLRPKSTFYALPSTLIEVDSIASHFKNVTTLENDAATEQALKKYLQQPYDYIHFATHGVIDENNPSQSGLALATTGGDALSSKEDGMLKSSEIYRLKLNSDMVVLSACNTALGKVIKGEGMLGLQRSFFYAGTATVVVSLWSVYDRSTAYLMNEFYKSMLAGESEGGPWYSRFLRWIGWDNSIPFGNKARAMREAKLKMIHHPLFNHPINWAPFIVVGR